MSLALYMDHNVHASITHALRERGIDRITAYEDHMAAASDAAILQRASDLGRVVFTQDVDFLQIATTWLREGRSFHGLIYARQMSITIGQAISDLELFAKVLEPAELVDAIEWIPLA